MIDVSLGFVVSSLPWWLAAPLVQVAVLVVGMALDETYVNRTTVLTAAIATHIHIFVAGEAGALVSLYADAGLAVGAYGLYAYVVDGYVGTWFRLLAYYVYSPLSAFLVILTAGPTIFGVEPLFLPAVAAAGLANYRFREYLRPEQPFYFGPRTQEEFEAVLETETPAETGRETGDTPTETATTDAAAASTASGTAAADADPAASGAGATATASSGAATETGRGGAQTATVGREAGAGAGTDTARSAAEPAGADAADGAESAAADGGSAFDHPGAEPADAADPSERGVLPKFMRRL